MFSLRRMSCLEALRVVQARQEKREEEERREEERKEKRRAKERRKKETKKRRQKERRREEWLAGEAGAAASQGLQISASAPALERLLSSITQYLANNHFQFYSSYRVDRYSCHPLISLYARIEREKNKRVLNWSTSEMTESRTVHPPKMGRVQNFW